MYRKYPALFFLIFSVYVCVVSRRLGLGTLHKPGAGFLPFWSGVFIGILALVLFFQGLKSGEGGQVEEGSGKVNWKSMTLTLVYFLAYIVCFDYVGFITATVLFVGVILKTIEKKSWLTAASVSVGMALASYYGFNVWLQAELPKGLIGF